MLLAIGALATALSLGRNRAPQSAAAQAASVQAGHELRDATFRGMVTALGLLIGGIVAIFLVVTLFQTLLLGRLTNFAPIYGTEPNVQPPPAPRLETANGQVLDELHRQEKQLLDNYQWIDQGAGTVRIPIDRAIDLTVQRGLPTQPGASPANAAQPRPQDSSSGRTQENTLP